MNAHNCGMGPVALYAPALYGIVDHPTLYGVTLGALPAQPRQPTRPPPGPPGPPPQTRPSPAPVPFPFHLPQPIGAHPSPAPVGIQSPVPPAAQAGYSTGAVILGVLGVAAAVALGVYAYRSWRAPAPRSLTPARRR